MKTIPKPLHPPIDVFTICISTVDDPDLKERLEEIAPNVAVAARRYERLATVVQLHTFPSVLNIGRVNQNELKKVYDPRMVNKNYPARAIYDEIKMAPPYGICPFCNEREIGQLDHHLPKKFFPVLSVVPLNLVPICQGCNFTKTSIRPINREDQTFHPYFDDFDSDRWLGAEVMESTPAALIFGIRRPVHWEEMKFFRLINHFNNLKLGTFYTTRAATELRNIQGSLTDLYSKGGTDEVRNHLIREYNSRLNADLNSWRTAMYEALANSTWFCGGGFNL